MARIYWLVGVGLLALVGCADDDDNELVPEERGALIRATALGDQAASVTNAVLAAANADSTVDRDVQAFELTYWSPNAAGDLVRLSGLVAVPTETTRPLALVAYQHGTIVERDAAPSRVVPGALSSLVSTPEGALVLALAAHGHLVVAADYVGLGGSQEFHPYVHADTEATAVVDALRAAHWLAERQGIELDGRLFLAGYSQGGHATMAAHRAIEQDYADELTVTASAPMAGPYDLSGTTARGLLDPEPHPHPFYTAYLMMAYNRLYNITAEEDLFVPEVAETLPALFDGTHGPEPLDRAMAPVGEAPPKVASDSISPAILEGITTDEDHPFNVALRDNDVYDFSPRAPVRLYHCASDLDVPPANSEVALTTLTTNGGTVELIDPGSSLTHVECVVPSLLDFADWIEDIE